MRAPTRLTALGVAAWVVADLTLGGLMLGGLSPASADASPSHHAGLGALSPEARAAGLTTAGGGVMGWRSRTTRTVRSTGAAPAATAPSRPATTSGASSATTSGATMARGIDVSSYQGEVDWASYYAQGKRFAYTKATEGSSYTNPDFSQQYGGSADAGLVHGAYHFANPGGAGGSSQASYFVANGGDWVDDGNTLPGALDIEDNPYTDEGGRCYGLSRSAMVSWISSFLGRYRSLTGRNAVIYTTTDWWTTCTGNTAKFAGTNTLWIARYAKNVGPLPAGWRSYTFWQYGADPVDQDTFVAGVPRLRTFAAGRA